jgi:hypothetical protein
VSGRLDFTHADAPEHRCALPRIRTWDDDAEDVFATIEHLPDGTRFTCGGCGTVYVVVTIPWEVTAHMATAPRHVWQVETRKQRRARLGLRWWQR